jgi:hypothetical protein
VGREDDRRILAHTVLDIRGVVLSLDHRLTHPTSFARSCNWRQMLPRAKNRGHASQLAGSKISVVDIV